MGRYSDVNITAPPKADRPVENKPMKAGQVTLNAELGEWLLARLEEVFGGEEPIWDDNVVDRAPALMLAELEKVDGWSRYSDKYGDHVYAATSYPASTPPRDTDELRLNIVLTRGVVKMDLRPWGNY